MKCEGGLCWSEGEVADVWCGVGRFISSKNSQIMSAQSLSVAPLAPP